MPLDPAAAAVLDALQGAGAPGIETLDPPGARRVFERLGGPLPPDAFAGVVATAERVGGVPCVRVSAVEPREAAPVVIWVHGGGWVLGTAEGALDIATQLVLGAGCEVVCVDYRLAPEAPFPAALDDVTAVARSLVGGPTDRIVIAGDSAGANLATVTAATVPGLAGQVLLYPVTDARCETDSYRRNGHGYLLTAAAMRWFVGHYLGGGDPDDPRVSPITFTIEELAASPPALVVTAGFDPLVDEGDAYAARLMAAGVEVDAVRLDGQIHGFVGLWRVIPDGSEVLETMTRWIGAATGDGRASNPRVVG